MIPDDVQSSIDMIRESARGIVSHGDLTRVRKLRFTDPGFDRKTWDKMCDMGWVALRLPEDMGGVDLGLLPYCALVSEIGRGLLPEPLVPAALAAALLEGDTLTAHLSGDKLVLPAWQDSRDATGPEKPLTVENGKVSATKFYVPVAGGADAFLVIGTYGAALVPADAEGVTVSAEQAQDGTTLAHITFDNTPGTAIDIDPHPALAEAALATAAYLLGLMDGALDMTVAYLKDRVQFGRSIGSFQVLQHMAVDLRLELEVSRASVENAAQLWDRDGPTSETYAAISRAKARASQSALKLTREAIQLHGGIGFTDEHDIGLYLRKAILMAAQFGSADCHRKTYAALKPIEEEA